MFGIKHAVDMIDNIHIFLMIWVKPEQSCVAGYQWWKKMRGEGLGIIRREFMRWSQC